jgi:hypothetical protein
MAKIMKIRIVTDAANSDFKLGRIFGLIYVEVAGVAFPGKGWTDFVVHMLADWSCDDNLNDDFNFFFYDGDVYMKLTDTSIELFDNGVAIATYPVNRAEFIREIRRAASAFLMEIPLPHRNHRDPYLQRLKNILSKRLH